MSEKAARIEMLRRLLKANGILLDGTDQGIRCLSGWFARSVEIDPINPGRLLPEWYSVISDVALFLGDALIERCPGLRWEFFTRGKKNPAYQRPVVVGFTRVPDLRYCIDFQNMITMRAHESLGLSNRRGTITVRGVKVDVDALFAQRNFRDDTFLRWMDNAEDHA